MSQRAFEIKCGLALSTIRHIREGVTQKNLDKISTSFPELNIGWLLTGEGSMLKEQQAEFVTPHVYQAPLVSKYAYAGYASGYGEDEYMASLPKYPFVVDHDPHGIYYAIEVKGDSMNDGTAYSIMDGDICLCRLIPQDLYKDSQLHLRQWYFVIVTTDGILIKRIVAQDIEAGTITLHSLNTMYPDQTVNLSQVKAIMNVVRIERKPIV